MMVHDPFGMITVGRNWEVGSEYRYGFNGKENESGIAGDKNNVDFGGRFYDSRIGRWFSIDPLSNYYESISPYSFAKNSPIQNVDIDGQYIKVITHASYIRYLLGFKPKIIIKVKGKLIDQTDNNYSKEDLKEIRDRMINQMEASYSGEGDLIKFKTKVKIKIAKNGDKSLNFRDHAFRLVDEGETPKSDIAEEGQVNGSGPFQENIIYINMDVNGLDKPAKTGPYAGTGKPVDYDENPRGTIERTVSHELGHSMGLEHPDPDTNPGNLMNQTGRTDAGLKVDEAQILEIKRIYDLGGLNGGAQK